MKKTTSILFSLFSVLFLINGHIYASHPFSANGSVIELPSTQAFQEIISKGNVIIKFTADSCPPCHAMEPFLARLAQTFSDKLLIVRVDVNRFRTLRDQYNIRSWPTLLFFKNGGLVRMVQGANPHQLESLTRTIFNFA